MIYVLTRVVNFSSFFLYEKTYFSTVIIFIAVCSCVGYCSPERCSGTDEYTNTDNSQQSDQTIRTVGVSECRSL